MDSSYIVRKTGKGEEELKTRSGGVSGNLRVILILVDGSSSIAEVATKGQGMPDVAGGLKILAEEGYVEFVAPGAINYDALKDELIHTVEEILGNDADKVVKKLHDAPATKEGLTSAASSCRKLVQLMIDEDKAEQLMTRCESLLGQH